MFRKEHGHLTKNPLTLDTYSVPLENIYSGTYLNGVHNNDIVQQYIRICINLLISVFYNAKLYCYLY